MPSVYPSVGNVARLTAVFTDMDGDPADPTVTVAVIRPPLGAGAEMLVTPQHDSAGNFHYDVLLTSPGTWWYRFIGTGAVEAQSADQAIYVPDPQF